MTKEQQAKALFLEGYNRAQAVFGAFCEELGLDFDMAMKLSSGFGGGMGRLREVCGSVSGMFMVLGFVKGYNEPGNYEGKKELYEHVQELARRYEEANGSIICRDLLGLSVRHDTAAPSERTPEYYAKRPCAAKIGSAAEILEGYLIEQGCDITY